MDDYGMKRYVLHVCCLDKHISCQRVAATCRTLERISRFVGKKTGQNSAAFTPENLGMDFFWRRFRTC